MVDDNFIFDFAFLYATLSFDSHRNPEFWCTKLRNQQFSRVTKTDGSPWFSSTKHLESILTLCHGKRLLLHGTGSQGLPKGRVDSWVIGSMIRKIAGRSCGPPANIPILLRVFGSPFWPLINQPAQRHALVNGALVSLQGNGDTKLPRNSRVIYLKNLNRTYPRIRVDPWERSHSWKKLQLDC